MIKFVSLTFHKITLNVFQAQVVASQPAVSQLAAIQTLPAIQCPAQLLHLPTQRPVQLPNLSRVPLLQPQVPLLHPAQEAPALSTPVRAVPTPVTRAAMLPQLTITMARKAPVGVAKDQWPLGRLEMAPLSLQQRAHRTSSVVPAAGVGADVDNATN